MRNRRGALLCGQLLLFGLELAIVPLLPTAVFDGVEVGSTWFQVLEHDFVLACAAGLKSMLRELGLTGSILNPRCSFLVRLPLQNSRVLVGIDLWAFDDVDRVVDPAALLCGIFAGGDSAVGILLGSRLGLGLSKGPQAKHPDYR